MNYQLLWQLAGWTMIHYLWLGALLALVALVVRLPLRRRAPAVRYALTLVSFLVLSAAPLAIAGWLWAHHEPLSVAPRDIALRDATPVEMASVDVAPVNTQADVVVEPEVVDLAVTPIVVDAPEDIPAPAAPVDASLASSRPPVPEPTPPLERFLAHLDRASQWLPWVWITGAPVTFLLLASGLVGAQRLRRSGTPITSGPVYDTCQRLRSALRLSREVALAVSDRVVQPVLVGIVRPLILLPPAALSGWSPDEIEMALVHELAHVRRVDNLVNLFQRLVESLLFFQPAVWLVSRWLSHDREQCCDAMVVRHTGAPEAYAELLINVASAARAQAMPLAASPLARHPLTQRIRRILQLEDDPMLVSRSTLGLIGLVLVAVVGVVVWQPLTMSVAQDTVDEVVEEEEEEASRVVPDPGEITESTEETHQIDTEFRGTSKTYNMSVDTPMSKVQELIAAHKAAGHEISIARKDDGIIQVIVRKQVPPTPAAATDSPFLPLEQQRIADLAYGMLNVEIAQLGEEKLKAVKEKGFAGGVMIDQVLSRGGGGGFGGGEPPQHAAGLQAGDILVGLHVWPTPDFDALAEVLRRPDLMEFSPLKYYVLREGVSPDEERKYQARLRQRQLELEREQERAAGPASSEFGGRGFEGGMQGRGMGGEFGGRGGEFGRGGGRFGARREMGRNELEDVEPPKTELRLITGRIPIPREAWAAEQARLGAIQDTGKSPLESRQQWINRLWQQHRETSQELTRAQLEQEALKRAKQQEGSDGPNFRNIGRDPVTGNEVGVPMESREKPGRIEQGPSDLANLRYDGKTFDQWRTQWKTELKTEKRTEAIKALAAFGRAGYGKEAAETILDVAGEYDFKTWGESNPEGGLKDAVLNALAPIQMPRIRPWLPPKLWLSSLLQRYEEGPERYRDLAEALILRIQTDDQDVIDQLLDVANGNDSPLRASAMTALIASDPALENPKIEATFRKHLTADELAVRFNALHFVFRRGQPDIVAPGKAVWPQVDSDRFLPELMVSLFHPDLKVRQHARHTLSTAPKDAVEAIVPKLLKVIDDPREVAPFTDEIDSEINDEQLQQARLEAIRALGALGKRADMSRVRITLSNLLSAVEEDVRVAATVAHESLSGREGARSSLVLRQLWREHHPDKNFTEAAEKDPEVIRSFVEEHSQEHSKELEKLQPELEEEESLIFPDGWQPPGEDRAGGGFF